MNSTTAFRNLFISLSLSLQTIHHTQLNLLLLLLLLPQILKQQSSHLEGTLPVGKCRFQEDHPFRTWG